MTTITIYPLIIGGTPIIHNIVKYAIDSGFTVTSYSDVTTDESTGTISAFIVVSQVLTSGQQTAINNLFQGTCKIVYS